MAATGTVFRVVNGFGQSLVHFVGFGDDVLEGVSPERDNQWAACDAFSSAQNRTGRCLTFSFPPVTESAVTTTILSTHQHGERSLLCIRATLVARKQLLRLSLPMVHSDGIIRALLTSAKRGAFCKYGHRNE
jgi:hypothetical protein